MRCGDVSQQQTFSMFFSTRVLYRFEDAGQAERARREQRVNDNFTDWYGAVSRLAQAIPLAFLRTWADQLP